MSAGADRSGLRSATVAVAGFVAVLGGLSVGLAHLWPKLATVEFPTNLAESSVFTKAPERSTAPTTPVLADLRPLEPEPAPPTGGAVGERGAVKGSAPAHRGRRAELANVARPQPVATGEAQPEPVQVAALARPTPAVALEPGMVVPRPIAVSAPAFAPPPAAAPPPAMAMTLPPPPSVDERVKRRDSVSALMTLRRQW